MRQLHKYVEIGGESCRHAYVLRSSSLPRADEGKEWYAVENFNAADELLEDSNLKLVFKRAIEEGCAVVNENDGGLKKGNRTLWLPEF